MTKKNTKPAVTIDPAKTIKWRVLIKKLGEFCYVKKIRGGNDDGEFIVSFDNGNIFQNDGFVLAAHYDGMTYLNPEVDPYHLPKAFAERMSEQTAAVGLIVWPKDMP